MASNPSFERVLLCLLFTALLPRPAAADDPFVAERAAATAVEGFGGRLEIDRDGRLFGVEIPRSKARSIRLKTEERLWTGGSAGLNCLKDIPHLKTIRIDAEGLNRDHGRMLAQLREVTTIVIRADDLRDEVVVELLGSTTLTRLSLSSPLLTDQCLEAATFPPGLKDLTIRSQEFKGTTLGRLAGCRNLQRLYLTGTGVNDAGTQWLPQIASLRVVDLNYTSVTDASLDHLLRVPKLGSLGIYDTKMTKDGVDAFERRTAGKVTVDR